MSTAASAWRVYVPSTLPSITIVFKEDPAARDVAVTLALALALPRLLVLVRWRRFWYIVSVRPSGGVRKARSKERLSQLPVLARPRGAPPNLEPQCGLLTIPYNISG